MELATRIVTKETKKDAPRYRKDDLQNAIFSNMTTADQ